MNFKRCIQQSGEIDLGQNGGDVSFQIKRLKLFLQYSAKNNRGLRKDFITVNAQPFRCLGTPRNNQVDFSPGVFVALQIRQKPVMGRVGIAEAIHVFNEIFNPKLAARSEA